MNISDLSQRTLENDFIFAHLKPKDRVLEVGCGNGFLTSDIRQRVAFVDSFDFSENMIDSAKSICGEKNNRFFVHSVLRSDGVKSDYDKIICVRVLINLASVAEQMGAIRNFARWVKPGGTVILIEGYLDGFNSLNDLRHKVGLSALNPASINFYSNLSDLRPAIDDDFEIIDTWHSGMFDVLTRVGYPLLVGADNATGPTEFHEKILPLARALNLKEFAPYARLHGFALRRR